MLLTLPVLAQGPAPENQRIGSAFNRLIEADARASEALRALAQQYAEFIKSPTFARSSDRRARLEDVLRAIQEQELAVRLIILEETAEPSLDPSPLPWQAAAVRQVSKAPNPKPKPRRKRRR